MLNQRNKYLLIALILILLSGCTYHSRHIILMKLESKELVINAYPKIFSIERDNVHLPLDSRVNGIGVEVNINYK